jgi:phenylalanyl-tRNA synthetase alpha chain
MEYKNSITKTQIEFNQNLFDISSLQELESLKAKYIGKEGVVTILFSNFRKLPIEEKKEIGPLINQLKKDIVDALAQKRDHIELKKINQKLAEDKIDLNWPIREEAKGSQHPISKVICEVKEILSMLGFSFVEGPEVEDEFHNFDALNIPKNHPARQMQDSFYMKKEGFVLRTHTSNVQIRYMKNTKPPLQIATIGKVYRADYDQTHTPMFHQIEGLMIDENINMSNMRWVLEEFLRLFFESDKISSRFRPSFFPFTEPSCEVDIGYQKKGNQIKIGGDQNFLEILGCGMVHPNVLKNVEIDNKKYQGFAFGIGVERLAMLKYGIKDIRMLFENNLQFLRHYK